MSDRFHEVEEVDIPRDVRVTLARAAVQVLADDVGADILHIKGEAVDIRLRPTPTPGSDVDALVRPDHVPRLDRILRAHDWDVYSSFAFGSPFGHAQTYIHSTWGFFDLHRSFPGIRLQPDAAFDLMWEGHQEIHLPGVDASTPSVDLQAVLLVLNAARNRGDEDDPLATWVDEPGLDRAVVAATVDRLQAHVAFAAASGDLDSYRGHPDYPLWKVITQGGARSTEWWARIRAARTVGEALRIIGRAPLVNVESLEHKLGRRPTRRDIATEFLARPVRAVREISRRGGAS